MSPLQFLKFHFPTLYLLYLRVRLWMFRKLWRLFSQMHSWAGRHVIKIHKTPEYLAYMNERYDRFVSDVNNRPH